MLRHTAANSFACVCVQPILGSTPGLSKAAIKNKFFQKHPDLIRFFIFSAEFLLRLAARGLVISTLHRFVYLFTLTLPIKSLGSWFSTKI